MPEPSEQLHIAVFVEGGVVQEVRASIRGVNVMLIDVDNPETQEEKDKLDKDWLQAMSLCPFLSL